MNSKQSGKGESEEGPAPSAALVTEAISTILASIDGEEPSRDGLVDTPKRVAASLDFLTQGYQQTPQEIVGKALFEIDPAAAQNMVLLKNIRVYSLCEHHMLPFFGECHIAYYPSADPATGKVVGLSKLPRLVNLFAQRLQVQERLTEQIKAAIEQVLHQPRGVAVVLECRHLCMEMRGVQQASVVTTTRARSGVFEDNAAWLDFLTSIGSRMYPLSAATENGSAYCEPCTTDISSSNVTNLDSVSALGTPDFALSSLKARHGTELDSGLNMYELYQQCATNEYSKMASVFWDCCTGPRTIKHSSHDQKISLLDIGAGNGKFLEALHESRRDASFGQYTAYEEDTGMFASLPARATTLGLADPEVNVRNETFPSSAKAGDELFDVVLLSHCLYGRAEKEELILQSLRAVAPGGVLLVFHRWDKGGTLDQLCDWLSAKKILYDLQRFDVVLDIAQLDDEQRRLMSAYIKVALEEGMKDNITRLFGCLAIEPHACDLRSIQYGKSGSSIRKVSREARQKQPAAIVRPLTVVGARSCLHAAALRRIGCGKVTVVGGGHSSNCYFDDGISVDMSSWDWVVADESSATVRIGGGATIGSITTECEKYGLIVPLGDRPGVGMGLILQGGLNHFMRRFGLACDNVLRVMVLDPGGHLSVVSEESELFPFLGAGNNFGIVLEVTMQAYRVPSVSVSDTRYIFNDSMVDPQLLVDYSEAALRLPNTGCLDGFIYWLDIDAPTFTTSLFDTTPELHSNVNDRIVALRKAHEEDSLVTVRWGTPTTYKPTELFDRELYMTPDFEPSQTTICPGEPCPRKLGSTKQCLLLRCLNKRSASILSTAVSTAPNKWCYIHLLHGGGASGTAREHSAFGCRDWDFAAVITGRYDYDVVEGAASIKLWLDKVVADLLPFSAGAYAADLGPKDTDLALVAFGGNTLRLANLKRQRDPLNILSCSVPLTGARMGHVPDYLLDPRVTNQGIVIVISGRRCAGKDWLATIVQSTLCAMLGANAHQFVSTASISDALKQQYSETTHHNVNLNRLHTDRCYKEQHRQQMSDFYKHEQAKDIAYDAKCYVKVVSSHTKNGGILLLTGMRDGLEYARRLAGRPVVLIKVDASDASKITRNWQPDPDVDESPGECAVDEWKDWDIVYDNSDTVSCSVSAAHWVRHTLAPFIVKASTRQVPDFPRPGILYKDIVGSLFAQPWGVSLCTSVMVSWLKHHNERVDVVLAPEALGIALASCVASHLHLPFVLARSRKGKLPGAVAATGYTGSNIQQLSSSNDTDGSTSAVAQLEIVVGSIRPCQKIVLVDDCLASGATAVALVNLVASQGAMVTHMCTVMELSDLGGRNRLTRRGVKDVFSMNVYKGQ